MPDRPTGDHADQRLRGVMSELAGLAPPAPDLEELLAPVLSVTESDEAVGNRTGWIIAAAAAVVIGIAGIGLVLASRGDSDAPTDVADDPADDADDPPATTTSADLASFTMDDQIAWLVAGLDAGELDPAEAEERIHPSFIAEVLSAPPLRELFEASGPWQVVSDTRDAEFAEITVESADGTQLTMTVHLASSERNQIDGLLFEPVFTDAPAGYTTAQLDADVAAFAPQGTIGIYEVTSGSCDVIHELNGDQPLAIGSVFKLWVLAELADQIAEDTAAWDEPLEVQADLRSNPAGQVYELADGDTLTLREYAEAMISISDNTAADHLIDRLGRESVEAAMVRTGVAEPELNQPFLATRELLWLKFLADAPNPADWYDADTDGRRALLDSLDGRTVPWVLDPTLATADNAEGLAQDQPRNLDIEYFASPHDLCRTLVHLDELASMPGLGPVADILSINPGMDFDTATWTDIRFKGGSEPGVVALAWWLGRHDGRQFVVAGVLNDPDVNFGQLAAVDLISNAIALI